MWLVCWLCIGALALVAEIIALIRKQPHDTLSEQIWAWLQVEPGMTQMSNALQSWRSFVVGAFMIWLMCHFLFGWWT